MPWHGGECAHQEQPSRPRHAEPNVAAQIGAAGVISLRASGSVTHKSPPWFVRVCALRLAFSPLSVFVSAVATLSLTPRIRSLRFCYIASPRSGAGTNGQGAARARRRGRENMLQILWRRVAHARSADCFGKATVCQDTQLARRWCVSFAAISTLLRSPKPLP